METTRIYFTEFLSNAFDRGDYSTDDVIAFLLPLFKEVSAIHESGLVAPFGEPDALFLKGHFLEVDRAAALPPSFALHRVMELFPRISPKNVEVVGPPRLPNYLTGYTCFEILLGHHDPQTDIFCLGLLLGSVSLGLNLYKDEDLQLFAAVRSNPSLHRPGIHPTLHQLILEMTEPDRRRRTQDLYDVIRRLQHYRDYDPEKQTDLSRIAGWVNQDLQEKESFILNRLRNRLFDTSRRNRLLYYKPNLRFVNLTVSSVPVVLHYQSIRPELLFTWNEELAAKVRGMKEIVLNKYLRFEDHAYLPSSLDRVRVESRRAIQEYGLSPLKLVISFLNWHNLKEDPAERIQSPLLLIPVELKKNKKLKEDHYVLKVLDNAAEVNPVLAGQLKELYGIRLPDFVDLEEMSPEQFYQLVKAQIDEANQGIVLNYIDKPRIMLFQHEARQIVRNYTKRLRPSAATSDPSARDTAPEASSQDATPLPEPPTHSSPEMAAEASSAEATPATSSTDTAHPPFPPMEEGSATEGPAASAEEGAPDLYTLAQSENNPYRWDFDVCNMVLGNFNYKKMSLVRDYNLVIDRQLQHPVFDDLFSDQPRTFKEHPFDLNRPDDWHHVIKADPTQTRAILQSRTGYSYIIQGPPGTGKSQTITNLIADFVARGKNILFVCEKRAALDVVFHRLKQAGLDELCCYIHDSQGDKRDFIKDLKATYEDFTSNKMDLAAIRSKRAGILERMNRQLDLLREFHTTHTGGKKDTGIETRALIERIIALRQDLPQLQPGEEDWLPAYLEWENSREIIRELQDALEEAGADPVFAGHPFSRVKESVFEDNNPHRLLDGLLQQGLSLLDEIEAVLRKSNIDPLQTGEVGKLKNLIQFAVLLHPLALSGNLALADPGREEAKDLGRRMSGYRHEQELHQDARRRNIHWKDPIQDQDLESSHALAAKFEGSFRGFLNGRWQKLKKQLQERYDFAAHAVRPTYSHVLEGLRAEYEAARVVEQSRRGLQQQYRVDNIETVWLSIQIIQNKKTEPGLEYLLQHPDAIALIGILQALRQPLHQLKDCLGACLQDPGAGNLSETRDELQNIQLNADSLPTLLPALRAIAGLPLSVGTALRYFPYLPVQVEAAIARKTLHQLYTINRTFAGIDGQALEKAALQVGDGYSDLQQLNADLIRAFIRQRFQQQVDLANMASGQLNEEQKKFKKIYNEGRKILENEFGKSMRFKSIRELSTLDSGRVLKDIKPIWLMSPYSVSDSLPLDVDHFDVVIFDEASQITLEEGVPALYRSRQAIIVGDERQMPPTDFFSARMEDPDDLEGRDGEDGDEWLSNDADSLLAQGARKLDSTLLSWHYRSHYETLISFSNHAFYEGSLLTIPDKTIHHSEKAPIEVHSPEDAPGLAGCLFDRSISYHFHAGGVYEKRSNLAEAGYIARLVRELLIRNTRESIGIVAFSQEQQRTIEKALDELAGEDAAFGLKLEEAYNRTEQDQFTGLIIKNLENIQGDERDIIIMSVCYGYDARKKMLMNFGPINKRGGEKRLNVLFSRAKVHMAVVSSIRHQDITNEYNEGASYLRRFLQYAEMVSRGLMKDAGSILNGLVLHKEASKTVLQPAILLQQLKQQIESLGYEVAEQVGQSDFKCSLAVKAKSGDQQYALGILIDDGQHYRNKNLIEQYYQRPAILQNFGWNILPVFAKDWLHQPQKVMQQIRKLLGETPQAQGPDGPGTAPGMGSGTASAAGIQDGPTGLGSALHFHRLLYREGGIEKFWEAAVEGNRLLLRWGRVATKGQVQLKSYPDGESANREMEKQIKEKVSKGYYQA